jgi:hypothetical protein
MSSKPPELYGANYQRIAIYRKHFSSSKVGYSNYNRKDCKM